MLTKVLRDGRTLAWREYGDMSGFPVLFAHGNLNSRLFAPSWEKSDAEAQRAGAKVISLDRPGYGGSSPHPNRKYTDWAADVLQLADHLQLAQFAMVGFSSGGPHAMACAATVGDRVSCLGLVSSDAPYARLGKEMVERMYGTANVSMEFALERADKIAVEMVEGYKGMKNEGRKAVALADIREATLHGLKGAASDSILEAADDWGFEIGEIGCPVHLWHGTDDADVPIAAAEFLTDAIGDRLASATFIEGESHTLIRRHWGSILHRVVKESKMSSGNTTPKASL